MQETNGGNLYNLDIYKRLNFQIVNTTHGLLGCRVTGISGHA